MPNIENIKILKIKKEYLKKIIITQKRNFKPIEKYSINFKVIDKELNNQILNNDTNISNGVFFYVSNIGKYKQDHLFEFNPLILKIKFDKKNIKINTKIIKNKRYYSLKKGNHVFQLYDESKKKFSFKNLKFLFDPESAPICNIIVNKNTNGEFVSHGEAGAWNLNKKDLETKGSPLISSPHGLIINGKYTTINTYQSLFKKRGYYSISNGENEKYFKLSNNQFSHMHDFYVTENYIILNCSIMTMNNSMIRSLLSPSFTSSVEMKKNTNNVYLFFNKNTFEVIKSYELEDDNFYVGHQEYAFEDSNGNVIIFRQISNNIEYSPYNLASLKNIKKKKPFFNPQILEKMIFNLNEDNIKIQPYKFGSGFLCINQNFMKISKQNNKGLQYLYFNDMVISNGFESIVAIDIYNNKQIGIWKKTNYFVGEPQIIPNKQYPYDEKKTSIIFIIINRENNNSFLIICDYKLVTLKKTKIDTSLNMGIHSSFY